MPRDLLEPVLDVEPSLDAFSRTYDAGRPGIVWTRLVADLETPVSAMLKLAEGRPMSFLLESVEGGAVRGRYSIIGLEPDVVWRAFGNRAEINVRPVEAPSEFVTEMLPTLASLRALLERSRIELPAELPPMAAGVFGYMGYDTVRLVEHLPDVPPDVLGVPDSILIRPTVMVIFDAVKDEMTVATSVFPKPGVTAAAAREQAIAQVVRVVRSLDDPVPHGAAPLAALEAPEPVSNTPAADYLAMVDRCKEYIAAGDAFQIVVSQRFSAPFTLPAFALYRALRRTNPSPFLFHLDFGDFALVGSSPEILVRARDGRVTIRPLAGTRRRGATPEEDRKLEEELVADPKERAEHLMLLDLGRNDVGRVAKIGTVEVASSFDVERYSQVMHLSSTVNGELDPRYDAIDALLGGFPAGTLSGAPKVRAMKIIDELEREKRGPYAGCVGYFSADGNMDTCIVLRTALVKDGRMYVQAGAGIVADSVPSEEQNECVIKARALFRAAEEAVRFAGRSRRGNN
ncbi:MAG: anthranilate synthase component I [Hyphomicrobiaceae bacterium]